MGAGITPSSETSSGRAIERALTTLPPGYRTIFLLHDVEGFEHQEIASQQKCTVGITKILSRQEMRRRVNTGILTTSRSAPKTIAAVSSQAITATGNGAIAIPNAASVEMIRMSATEESTSQTLGRGPQ